jgi:hypothetical protein
MYKGSIQAVLGLHSSIKLEHPLSFPGTPLVHGVQIALGRLVRLGMAGMRA